jgi:ABC-2 type transport system ATP-binding protein
MLTTVLEPTSGTAKICGFDIVKQSMDVRKSIGVTFQEMVLDVELTGKQVLDYHGRLYKQNKLKRREKIEELLALVELEDAADRPVKTYSGGMKRRLELARALMTTPEILFLDEPTLGLDPQTRIRIWDYILYLQKKEGMTILLTTHYMEEAEQLANLVAIIDNGQIMIEGPPKELINKMGADIIHIVGNGKLDQFNEKVKSLSFVKMINKGEKEIQIGVDNGNKRLVEIISFANNIGFQIDDISLTKPSLGEVFFQYTGRQLREK